MIPPDEIYSNVSSYAFENWTIWNTKEPNQVIGILSLKNVLNGQQLSLILNEVGLMTKIQKNKSKDEYFICLLFKKNDLLSQEKFKKLQATIRNAQKNIKTRLFS